MAQLRAFLDGTVEVQFRPPDNDIQRYGFIESALKRLSYAQLRRADKAVVLRYLQRTTGYSRYRTAFDDARTRMAAAYATGDYTLQAIADAFGVHYSTVSRAVSGK